MSTTLSTSQGKYQLEGFTATFLGFSHKVTVPIAFVIGGLGVCAGIMMGKDVLWLSGGVALVAGWIMKVYIEAVFEKYGHFLG